MTPLQSNILELLNTSSLPGLYKAILENLLPDLPADQQRDLFTTLLEEDSRKQVLRKKMKRTHWRYSSVLNRLEKNPDDFKETSSFLPTGPGKKIRIPSLLGGLKRQLNLKSLKKQVGKTNK
jgi:hypothetical protein